VQGRVDQGLLTKDGGNEGVVSVSR
jgi:hypothetical protein